MEELEPRLSEDLELASKRDRKRVETEWNERFRRVRRRAETAALDLQLELAGLWYRDLSALAAGAEDMVLNADRLTELSADVAGRDPGVLREGLELVEATRRSLRVNVSEELACEALAYRLAAALGAPATAGAR